LQAVSVGVSMERVIGKNLGGAVLKTAGATLVGVSAWWCGSATDIHRAPGHHSAGRNHVTNSHRAISHRAGSRSQQLLTGSAPAPIQLHTHTHTQPQPLPQQRKHCHCHNHISNRHSPDRSPAPPPPPPASCTRPPPPTPIRPVRTRRHRRVPHSSHRSDQTRNCSQTMSRVCHHPSGTRRGTLMTLWGCRSCNNGVTFIIIMIFF
jgi:hypothetical protein